MSEPRAACSCGTPGLNYEGPQIDCEIHGLPYDEVWRMLHEAREDKVDFGRWRDKWIADMQALETRLAISEDAAEAAEAEVRSLRAAIEKEHCAACGNGMGLCRDCKTEAAADLDADCTCGNVVGHAGECR